VDGASPVSAIECDVTFAADVEAVPYEVVSPKFTVEFDTSSVVQVMTAEVFVLVATMDVMTGGVVSGIASVVNVRSEEFVELPEGSVVVIR